MPPNNDLQHALLETYGFSEFRPLQEEAVDAALAGRDLLVVMPTGAGKSLCFQLPAALQEGLTLVVSPLIALMRDQVDALNRRPAFQALGCACLTSLQSSDEQRQVLDRLRAGLLRLLYVAPERFRAPTLLSALRAVPIARFVVDEAHCISEWGHDFRPDYLTLKSVVESLGNPPLTAVTATATRRVQESIVANLGMRDPEILVGGFNRPNLHFSVYRCKSESERESRLTRALPKLSALGGSGLIYVATRKQCEDFAALAAEALAPVGQTAAPYHAGLDTQTRNAMQQRWLDGEIQVLVATSAFGMGIDKPDVRFVIHCACPDSLESYYQEAGRAGRDGRKSRCVILYHFTDRRTREWFIENEALTVDAVKTAHADLCARPGESARLPKNAWARAHGWSDTKTRLILGELERAGLIQRTTENADDLTVRLIARDFSPPALGRISSDLLSQRKARLRRLDEIIDYCKTTHCRRRTVLDYFGDRQEPQSGSFCCDNCDNSQPVSLPRPTANRAAAPMPAQIDGADIYAVLQGLDALRPALGKARLNKLLRATGAQETAVFRPESSPLFGVLRGCTRGQVDTLLAGLIADGLLHQGDEDEYFVCTGTPAGRAAWQEKRPLTIALPRPPGEMSAVSDSDALALYDALRAWRGEQARAAGLPSYCIFGDKTLREIAAQKPQSPAALRAVPGIGDAKMDKYGDAVLALIAQSESRG